jgi:Capsular polysaccharide synthesis protein
MASGPDLDQPCPEVNRTIWTCWLQGEDRAPRLVRRCLSSWPSRNPGWDFRCLDARTLTDYVQLPEVQDKPLSPASFVDVLRVHLLRDYGGVWVDATVYCHRSLDEWLSPVFRGDFFAFSWGFPDRPLASWFLAARVPSLLVSRWFGRVQEYWTTREYTTDYFWLHHLFGALCEDDPEFAQEWRRVPKLSARPPHAIQDVGMTSTRSAADPRIDWTVPVFKLSHRLAPQHYRPGTLVWDLLESGVAPGPLGESP